MSRETLLLFTLLRSGLFALGGVLLLVAGHGMRGQGSGIPWDYGLVAYGLGLALLGLAIPTAAMARSQADASSAARR